MYSGKDVTLIVLTHGRYEYLKKFFESLAKLRSKPARVIIVDSSPGKGKDISKMVSGVDADYFKIDPSIRMTHARNLFIGESKTSITSFVDDDVYLTRTWLEGVLDGFNSNPSASGVTGPCIDAGFDLKPLKKLVRDNKNRNYVNSFGMVSDASPYQINDVPFRCFLMKGANMNFKTSVLKKHRFDSTYEGNCLREDSDICVRIVRDGGYFVYHPKAFLYHLKAVGTGTRKHGDDVYFYEAGMNHKYFCDKYFNRALTRISWIFFCKFPPSLVYCVLAYFLKKKNCFPAHKALWFGRYPKKPRAPAHYVESHVKIHHKRQR